MYSVLWVCVLQQKVNTGGRSRFLLPVLTEFFIPHNIAIIVHAEAQFTYLVQLLIQLFYHLYRMKTFTVYIIQIGKILTYPLNGIGGKVG